MTKRFCTEILARAKGITSHAENDAFCVVRNAPTHTQKATQGPPRNARDSPPPSPPAPHHTKHITHTLTHTHTAATRSCLGLACALALLLPCRLPLRQGHAQHLEIVAEHPTSPLVRLIHLLPRDRSRDHGLARRENADKHLAVVLAPPPLPPPARSRAELDFDARVALVRRVRDLLHARVPPLLNGLDQLCEHIGVHPVAKHRHVRVERAVDHDDLRLCDLRRVDRPLHHGARPQASLLSTLDHVLPPWQRLDRVESSSNRLHRLHARRLVAAPRDLQAPSAENLDRHVRARRERETELCLVQKVALSVFHVAPLHNSRPRRSLELTREASDARSSRRHLAFLAQDLKIDRSLVRAKQVTHKRHSPHLRALRLRLRAAWADVLLKGA
mmetsp:Transcript_61758/g.152058  ORF Transcript_61758/g.152058 Transcript_61758/m.152058 type:complete len:388 (+) Transcript_61758:440-1603(+)